MRSGERVSGEKDREPDHAEAIVADSLPPDVLDALTDESIERMMLSLQGPGIMLVDDGPDAAAPPEGPPPGGPDLESEDARVRLHDLRSTLGVAPTARPSTPREPRAPPPAASAARWAWVVALGLASLGFATLLAALIALSLLT